MAPLERLFVLEIEFHQRLRQARTDPATCSELHTSWAISEGYQRLIRDAGRITADEILQLAQRMMAARDVRDLLAARDSVMSLLGVR